MDFRFLTDSTTFECQRCSECCSLDVMLSEKEMELLGDAVDRAWRTTKKVRAGKSFVCCLLRGRECSIYAARPLLCRLYPFLAIPEDDFKALGIPIDPCAKRLEFSSKVDGGTVKSSYVVIYDEGCPGLGKGKRPHMHEIVSMTLEHHDQLNGLRRG